MSSPSASDDAHMPQLDGLRAIAATLVVVEHFAPLYDYLYFSTGRLGVWLFFALSGFLITGILAKSRDLIDVAPGQRKRVWQAFYMRRILRIWPLYYALLLVAVVLNLTEARHLLPWYMVHLANFGVATTGWWVPSIGHYWTLGIEEQFYLVWPIVILFAPRRFAIPVVVAAVLGAPLFRLLLMTVGHQNQAVTILMTPSGFDGLGMGALLALIRRADWANYRKFLNAGLALGVVVLAVSLLLRVKGKAFALNVTGELFAFALISTWLVGNCADGFKGVVGKFLTLAPMLYLGRISYGIYMFNLPLADFIEIFQKKTGMKLPIPEQLGLSRFVVCFLLSVGLASLSWYLLERPLNELKRFFPYPTRAKGPEKASETNLDLTVSAT